MLLADYVLRRYRDDCSHRIRGFMPCAVEAIHNYPWPGNVRELINRIRFAVVMTNGPMSPQLTATRSAASSECWEKGNWR